MDETGGCVLENGIKSTVALLKKGQPPGNAETLLEISVGINALVDFISDHYFKEYIACGGSKIKFVTGKPGSGKTHLLQMLSAAAGNQGFITVHISAKDVWLHDFKEIYAEVIEQTNLMLCLEQCAAQVAAELGHDYGSIPPGMKFVDYLSSIGELDALTKKEIRNQLRQMFIQNPMIDNNFAIACSLLTGCVLGHPTLENTNITLLHSWLSGSKDVKIPALRNLGMSPSKITKFNARHMLRSLLETLKMGGFPGIIVFIDNMEMLISATSLDNVRYTKLRRDDVYESIRELIDEIDTLKNIMFFFAFNRLLLDDESSGLKSYQALWMRMQNEIVSSRFNKFTDFYDMDKYAESAYDIDVLAEMSERLAGVLNRAGIEAVPVDEDRIEELILNAKYTAVSLPRQIVKATLDNTGSHFDAFDEADLKAVEDLYDRF